MKPACLYRIPAVGMFLATIVVGMLAGCGGGDGGGGSNVTTGSGYTIGGSVSGLSPGAAVALQNNGADNLTVTSNGSFVFATPVSNGGRYSVTVLAQPSGETCTVASGSGTASANVTGVIVTCTATTANCPTVTGAATLSLTAGSPFHSFVLKTSANANNVSYSGYSFDFSLQGATSTAATVNVTDGKNPSLSVADLGTVCGLGAITTFPAKAQFSSSGTLILQPGHGYFVEAPNGTYARLYISKVTTGSGVDIQYEYPSVICPSSGVTMTYDIGFGGVTQTYSGVSISGALSQGGNINNNGTLSSAYSTPFFGCNATATVQAWGGGGAGGGYYDLIGGAGGGGGGGGGYGSQSLSLSPGQYYLVTVGRGGETAWTNGYENGQFTVFSTYSATDTTMTGTSIITSTGGQGGKASISHTSVGIGGVGGTSNATGTSSPGQSGTNGVTVASSPCSPGQVWGIGPGGYGGNAGGFGGAGAIGGCTPGGAGIPGGGGAGASQNGGATNGANGRIIISY